MSVDRTSDEATWLEVVLHEGKNRQVRRLARQQPDDAEDDQSESGDDDYDQTDLTRRPWWLLLSPAASMYLPSRKTKYIGTSSA